MIEISRIAKPQPFEARLDFSNPLCRDLRDVYIFNDLASSGIVKNYGPRGIDGVLSGAVSLVRPLPVSTSQVQKEGYQVLQGEGIDNDGFVNCGVWDGGPTLTICHRSLWSDNTANSHIVSADDSPTNRVFQHKFNAHVPSGGPALRALVFVGGDSNGIVGDNNIETDTWLDGALTSDGVNGRMYLDGKLDAEWSTGPMNNVPAILTIGADKVGPTQEMNGQCAYVYRWDRALGAGEVAQIHENPYRIFEPLQIYEVAAVAAGRTMSSLAGYGGLAGMGGIAGRGGGIAG